jgi:hypothetical protein
MTLGVCVGVVGICFLLFGAFLGQNLPAGAPPFYALGTFCEVVAVGCLFVRSRPFALRIVGAAVCGAYLWYTKDVWRKPIHLDFDASSEHGLIGALFGLFLFGLPGAYVAVTGRYPRLAIFSELFGSKARSEPESSPEDENGPPPHA